MLLRLYETTKEFEGDTHVKNWLMRVTVNECKQSWRSPWSKAACIENFADDLVFEDRHCSDLFDAIMALDKKYRTVIVLHYCEGYTTQEGGRFQVEYQYDADSRYLRETEYILSSEYNACYVYTTRDQVEAVIEEYDGQIWASAVNVEAGNAVYIHTTGCIAAETETILDSLHLAAAMQAGTQGNKNLVSKDKITQDSCYVKMVLQETCKKD